MESKEIVEGNRLIAEFMEGKIPGWPSDLKYHSSWDWIMPVIYKIESIYDNFHGYFGIYIHSNCCTIQGTKLDTRPESFHPAYMSDPNAIFKTKIESTWYNIVRFIEWRKSQIVKPL